MNAPRLVHNCEQCAQCESHIVGHYCKMKLKSIPGNGGIPEWCPWPKSKEKS